MCSSDLERQQKPDDGLMEHFAFLICKGRDPPPVKGSGQDSASDVHIVAYQSDVSKSVPFVTDQLQDICGSPFRFGIDIVRMRKFVELK